MAGEDVPRARRTDRRVRARLGQRVRRQSGAAQRSGAPGAMVGARSQHDVKLFQLAQFASEILQNLQLKCSKW
jgi:hypothetical protein